VDKCDPEYWFIAEQNLPRVLLRGNGQPTFIPDGQLLAGRAISWAQQNTASSAWGKAWGLDPNSHDDHLLATYTSGNSVEPLVDGAAYLRDLLAELTGLNQGFVLLAGWEFWTGRWLDDTGQLDALLPNVLTALSGRGVETRLLAFDNPILGIRNNELVDVVNRLYPSTSKPPQRAAYLDGDLGGFAISHHQKEVFVGTGAFATCCAYVGGIDLGKDRFDDGLHKKTQTENRFYGWHDVQVKVSGDALTQIWANFAQRWGAVQARITTVPSRRTDYQLLSCPVPTYAATTPGTQHVQVLRTVAPAPSSNRGRFMPDGERTFLVALQKAVSLAECYIYIEEQFLWDCEIADFIGDRMKANPDLRLIIVMAAETELPINLGKYHFHLRSLFLMRVMNVTSKADIAFGRTTRVYAYGLYQTDTAGGRAIYVHSKLVIIDDRYVAIGSANVDSRSLYIETELTLGIVDAATQDSTLNGAPAKVCTFAKNLRETIWKEHLNVTTLPDDPIVAFTENFPRGDGDGWPTRASQAKSLTRNHVRCYINIPGYNTLTPAVQRILDRNQRRWRRVGGGK